jgi:hypothetical protein
MGAGTSSDGTSKCIRQERQPKKTSTTANWVTTLNKTAIPVNITQGSKSTTGLASNRCNMVKSQETTCTINSTTKSDYREGKWLGKCSNNSITKTQYS